MTITLDMDKCNNILRIHKILTIESMQTTFMVTVSTGVVDKIKNAI